MARSNRKGRTKGGGRFVRLTEHLLQTPAYRSLSPTARAMLVEFRRLFDGRNNGHLRMSVRQAAERCGCSQRPAMRAIAELQEHGFIKPIRLGAFSLKVRHATEWALTDEPVGGALPTHDYRSWEPQGLPVKKQNTVSHSAADRCPIRQQKVARKESVPSHGVPFDSRFGTFAQSTVSHSAAHIDIYHRPQPETEQLQPVSAFVPEGVRNPKAQSLTGTGSKIVQLHQVEDEQQQVAGGVA